MDYAAGNPLAGREAAMLAEELAADQRQDTADRRQETADQRQIIADQRQETADLRQEAADLRQIAADQNDAAARAKDELGAITEAQLREANERLVVATVRVQTMTEAAEGAAARMSYMAEHDFLTGLPNRSLLTARLAQSIALAQRHGRRVALLYLDLDHFKHINDSLGHTVGDQLLQSAATRLQACLRISDTVCRQGGDEFVVLLPGLDGVEPACLVARKILAACDAAFELAGNPVRVGVSGGIALFPQHGSTFDELSRHADGAMYAAKRGGRMRCMLYRGPDAEPEAVLPVPDLVATAR